MARVAGRSARTTQLLQISNSVSSSANELLQHFGTEGFQAEHGDDHAPCGEEQPSQIDQIQVAHEAPSASGVRPVVLKHLLSRTKLSLRARREFAAEGSPSRSAERNGLLLGWGGRSILHVFLHAGLVLGLEFFQLRLLVSSQQLVHLTVNASLLNRKLGFDLGLLRG